MGGEPFQTDPKPGPSHKGHLSEHGRRTMAAWEQFVAGHDDVQGVSSSVLLSWYRCRDLYRVDPRQTSAPRAAGQSGATLAHSSAFAQLGGIAAALVDRNNDCLSTVTDGDGRILASWGNGPTMRKATDSNLAPFFVWSESAIGTNGMGTALNQDSPMVVRGPEHWCEGLHDWYCTGVAIYDSLTNEPIAALNVSSWEREVPIDPKTLTGKTETIRRELRSRALNDANEVTREFVEAERHARGGALIAMDIAGNIIATNERARASLSELPEGPVLDPDDRKRHVRPELREIARKATQRALSEPDWTGAADLGFLAGNRNQVFSIAPIMTADGVIGLLLSDVHADYGTERVDEQPAAPRSLDVPKRIPAVYGERILLLSPEEIRYAEAARHDVWLMTDRGRVRAAMHGIDNVELELAPFGFMRVHRSYVVNVARIREISERGNGALTLSTDPHSGESIAVSRRWAVKLRRLLKL